MPSRRLSWSMPGQPRRVYALVTLPSCQLIAMRSHAAVVEFAGGRPGGKPRIPVSGIAPAS
jgi:hypothetical protein